MARIRLDGIDFDRIEELAKITEHIKQEEHQKKYFVESDIEKVFSSVDSCIAGARREEFFGTLDQVKAFLKLIVDQAYVCRFKSVEKVLKIMWSDERAEVVQVCLEIMGLVVQALYKHPQHRNLLGVNSQLKRKIVFFGILVGNGFRVSGNDNFEVTEFTKSKDTIIKEYAEVLLDSPRDGFEKISFDLKPHLDNFRSDFQSFERACTEFVDSNYKFLSEDVKSILKDCLTWRGRLLSMSTSSVNKPSATILLCLAGKTFVNRTCSLFAEDVLLSLDSLVNRPTPISVKTLSTLLKNVHDADVFHSLIMRAFIDCDGLKSDEDASDLVIEMLEEYNQDTLRRRSSGISKMEEELLTSTMKNSDLLVEVFRAANIIISKYSIRDEINRDGFKFVQLIMGIFDKSVEGKNKESITLHYSPECYIRGFQAISSDSNFQLQTMKDSDSFLETIMNAKELYYLSNTSPTGKTEISDKQRNNISIEIVNSMITLINEEGNQRGQQGQLHAIINEFSSLKLWEICFSPDSKISPKVKVLAHKLLVGFFEDLQPQYIPQASEKFLSDKIIEGIFQFVQTCQTLDLGSFINTFYLISKLVHNKKIERYVYESEIIKFLFKKLIQKDIFLRSYLKKSKENLSSIYTSISEAIFEISNNSEPLSELIEGEILNLLKTVSSMQAEMAEWVLDLQTTGKTKVMIDESSLLLKYWECPDSQANLSLSAALFEEFTQVILQFFRKFLEIESTNLAAKLIDKQEYVPSLLELFLSFSWPNFNNMNDRISLLLETFTSVNHGQSQNISQIQIMFFNTIILPRLVLSLRSFADQIAQVSTECFESSLKYLLAPHSKRGIEIETIIQDKSSIALSHNYAQCSLLCALSWSGLQIAERITLEEDQFLEIVDTFINSIVKIAFVPHTLSLLQNLKTTVENHDSSPVSFDTLIVKPDWDLVSRLATTIKEFARSKFNKNSRVISLLYGRLGGLVIQLPKQNNILQDLFLKFELVNIVSTFFTQKHAITGLNSRNLENCTSFVAYYEGGLINKLEQVYPELISLVQESLFYLNNRFSGKIDEVLLSAILQVYLPKMTDATIYTIHQTNLEVDKFHRGGVEFPKLLATGKCRFVRLKLYDNLKNLLIGILKWSAELYDSSSDTLERLSSQFESSPVSSLEVPQESLKKLEKSFMNSFEVLLKSAISFNVKDMLVEKESSISGWARPETRRVPVSVINKLIEFGFEEEKIRFAANHVRNPADFNEVLEWMLANGDQLEAVGRQAQPEEIVEAEELKNPRDLLPNLLDAPSKEINELKAEIVEQYKRFCQTLIKYFLFIPFQVDFVGVLQNYTNHVHDNLTSGKSSSRQFLFDLYYLFVDFLILLKSQLAGLKSGESYEDFEVRIPSKFNKVKTVVFCYPDRCHQASHRNTTQTVQSDQLRHDEDHPTDGRYLHDSPRSHRHPDSRGRVFMDPQLRS